MSAPNRKDSSATNHDDQDLAKDAEGLFVMCIFYYCLNFICAALAGLFLVIGVNESCTLRDDTSCESGLNEFTDHDIALLFEDRFHIENVVVVNSGTCGSGAAAAKHEAATHETFHETHTSEAQTHATPTPQPTIQKGAGTDTEAQHRYLGGDRRSGASSNGTAGGSCHTLRPPV